MRTMTSDRLVERGDGAPLDDDGSRLFACWAILNPLPHFSEISNMSSDEPVPEDDDGDSEDGEPISCPYCDKDQCEHRILFWSAGNLDWDGSLAGETMNLDAALRQALWDALKAKNKKPAEWKYALSNLVSEARALGLANGGPEECDWFDAIRTYWRELVQDSSDCYENLWSFDGHPGNGDTYGSVYAGNPAEAVAGVAAACKRDIELLHSFAVAPPTTPPAGKRKRRKHE